MASHDTDGSFMWGLVPFCGNGFRVIVESVRVEAGGLTDQQGTFLSVYPRSHGCV